MPSKVRRDEVTQASSDKRNLCASKRGGETDVKIGAQHMYAPSVGKIRWSEGSTSLNLLPPLHPQEKTRAQPAARILGKADYEPLIALSAQLGSPWLRPVLPVTLQALIGRRV